MILFMYGKCGLRIDIRDALVPMPIERCIKNGITFVDIATGCYHNLVLDDQARMFAFAYNTNGQ